MSLTILRAEWWREKLFKKNKIIEELPKRSEKFNKIKARIDEVIEIQFNGGWKLTEEEQKIQDEFLPKLFKEMTGKKELPERPQITTLVPRNETEAVEMLKKINKRFPGIIENFAKSNSKAEEMSKINEIYKVIRKMYEEMKKMHKEMERINEKKEKRTILDEIRLWKEQPKTFRVFAEQLCIRNLERTSPRLTTKAKEENFLKTLKRLERYFPSYTSQNKKKASKLFEKILKISDIQERDEIKKRIEALIEQAKS